MEILPILIFAGVLYVAYQIKKALGHNMEDQSQTFEELDKKIKKL